MVPFFSNALLKWRGLPKKFKLLTAILLNVIGAALLFYVYKGIGFDVLKFYTPSRSDLVDSGEWTKLVIPQREAPFFVLSARTQKKYGISPQEVFILKTKQSVDLSFINEVIDTSSPVTTKKISDTEFQLTPNPSLGLDQQFSIKLATEAKNIGGHSFDRDYSWAFQTQPKFKVVSTIPGNNRTYVPLNTGIEFVFNQDDYQDIKPFLSIEPKIDFKVEKRGETVSIIPAQPLSPLTKYTITLSRNLSLISRNDPLGEDVIFSFQTQDEPKPQQAINLSDNFVQISTKEAPIAKVFTNNWNPDSSLKANIFKFQDSGLFVASMQENSAVDVSKLAKIGSADIKVQSREDVEYIQLPEKLQSGFYLVTLTYDTNKEPLQFWLQSTDIAGYVSVGRDQTVIWANSIDNGPTSGAKIRLLGTNRETSTNDQGWAAFATPTEYFGNTKNYVEIIKDEHGVLLPIPSFSYQNSPQDIDPNDFWSYIYHERNIYKPSDTVYYWGVLKNRDTNSTPQNAEVKLTNSYYGDGDFVIKRSIIASSDGSFIGNFKLDNVAPGWYNLSVNIGGVEIARSGLNVLEYKKPEMKIEVTASKKAIFAGEKVDFSAQTSFFDGTPASSTELNVYEYSKSGSNKATTDSNGSLKHTYSSSYSSNNYYPRYEGITLSPALAGEATIEGHGSIYVYGSKFMIETDTNQEKEKAEVKAKVFNVDLDSYNQGTASDVKGPPAKNQKVKIEVKKSWYEKKETGSYYDFVEKVTRPTYNYERREEKLDEKELYTNDSGELTYSFSLEREKSYSVNISTTDDGGRVASKSEYFYYYQGQENDTNTLPTLNLNKDINEYSINEEVKITVQKQGELYKDTDSNRFLFILANRGKQEVITKDNPELTFSFRQDYIPNIYAGAIVFTGKNYQPVNIACQRGWYCPRYDYYYENGFQGAEIRYKKEDSQLKVDIKTNSEKYSPGDKAELEIIVTKNGNPVEGATVQLTLVDEALAAIGGVIKPTTLSSLYKSVNSLIYYNYYTHKPILPSPPQAEMGGGGGDRELFKDTAFFETAKTSANGKVNFVVNLPDDITSWLIYAQAVNPNMDAGHAEASTIVTKEFFVTNHFPSNILTRDNPFISANSFGRSLNSGNKVTYEAIFKQGDIEIKKVNQTGDAFKDTVFPFPSLTTGEYKLIARGKFSDYEDGISLPLTVSTSRLNFEYAKAQTISSGQSYSIPTEKDAIPEKGIKIAITDKGKGQYYHRLSHFCYGTSNRIEKKIAQLAANTVLMEIFDSKDCLPQKEDITVFQYSDGGLSQVSWGGSNLETTLWATLIDPSFFDKENLIAYFENKYKSSSKPEEKIYSAWGLTLLGEPHILELNLRADSAASFKEKVLSGLALATTGNKEKARDVFFDIMSDYAYTNKPYIRIQSGTENMDTYLNDTSLTLLLGSYIHKEYDSGMNLYLRDYRTFAQDIVLDIADIAYISEELEKLPTEDTSVSVNVRGQQTVKDLSRGKSVLYTLSVGDISTFSTKVIKGQAEITTNYFLTPTAFESLATDSRLSINRSYKKVKGEGNQYKPGDIIEVTIKYDLDEKKAPLGTYYLIDHLPSGLTYLENPYFYGINIPSYIGYMYQIRPNVIQGYVSNSPWWFMYSSKKYVYYARVTGVGTYIAEPAFIQAQIDKSIFQKTPEEKIEIKNN